MNRRFTIQKCTALVLLLLFCSSMVPKQTWHHVLVSHQQAAASEEKGDVPQLKAHKFNCTGHQPDVQCPYLGSQFQLTLVESSFPPLLRVLHKNDPRQILHLAYALRGPPAFVA